MATEAELACPAEHPTPAESTTPAEQSSSTHTLHNQQNLHQQCPLLQEKLAARWTPWMLAALVPSCGDLSKPLLRLLVLTDTRGRELCLVLFYPTNLNSHGHLEDPLESGHCRGKRSLLFI